MNSNGDKICIKLVDIDEIYNFVVQTIFIQNHLRAQIINTIFRSKNHTLDMIIVSIISAQT
jgi:hypothetical protein